MPITLDRLVFQPEVSIVATTVMTFEGLDSAIAQSGAEDAAERVGSPLSEMLYRVGDRTGNGDDIAEFGGRQCYRSWGAGRPQDQYIANVINEGHGSIFEHASIVFQITGVSRALTHELIRHRAGTAVSQESQRYVDAKDIRFVVPPIMTRDTDPDADPEMLLFRRSCNTALQNYQELQGLLTERLGEMHAAGDYKGATAYKKRANEAARALLPNAAETRLLFTANLRSLRHILSLRGSEYADLEIRRLAVSMLTHASAYAPHFFEAVTKQLAEDGYETVTALNGKV